MNEAEKGGAIAVKNGEVDIGNAILQNNQASIGAGLFQQNGTISVSNATLESNIATQGGGIASQNGTIEVRNTDITNNIGSGLVEIGGQANIQVLYSNLYGNIPENFVGDNTIETLNGNLSTDPIYVNSGSNALLLNTTSSGTTSLTDVRLSSLSPLIDSGDNTILDPDNTVSDVGAWGGPNADNWDLDGDGFAAKWEGDTYVPSLDIALGWDCDDSDARVYPYASDILGDDLDTNCDGLDGTDADFDELKVSLTSA